MGADFHRYLLTVYFESFFLEVWLPDFLGVALREADITAELLALASDFTLVHDRLFLSNSSNNIDKRFNAKV